MALFSKPPAKKPHSVQAEPNVRPSAGARGATARQVVQEAGGHRPRAIEQGAAAKPEAGTPKRSGSNVIEWSPAPRPADDALVGSGLCGVLENAALLFAGGQLKPARAMLEDGIANDADAIASDLTWLALFDLMQRERDHAAFDELALRYVVHFERSAPAWENTHAAPAGQRAPSPSRSIVIAGKLTAVHAAQVAAAKSTSGKAMRMDLSAITDFEDDGARALANALAAVRRQRAPLVLERAERLRGLLRAAVSANPAVGEGGWLLLLEILQWQGDQAAFDDCAVEYAVALEVSPPSWEPPSPSGSASLPSSFESISPIKDSTVSDSDAVVWTGEVTGASPTSVSEVLELAENRKTILLDLSKLERIDFAGGAALANAVDRLSGQRKTLQITGASAIIRALLYLVGLPTVNFIR